MVEATVFIGAAIIGFVQFVKLVGDRNYWAASVILFAVFVGVLVALLDTKIGVVNISVAQGVILGLAAPGVVTLAEKI